MCRCFAILSSLSSSSLTKLGPTCSIRSISHSKNYPFSPSSKITGSLHKKNIILNLFEVRIKCLIIFSSNLLLQNVYSHKSTNVEKDCLYIGSIYFQRALNNNTVMLFQRVKITSANWMKFQPQQQQYKVIRRLVFFTLTGCLTWNLV